MIRAEFLPSGGRISLKMSGHAGYSRSGGDIVCAAVSGIFYALIGYLANEGADLSINRLSGGDVDIDCSASGAPAMRLAYIGFLQIALSYPGTVDVCESVWGGTLGVPLFAKVD